MKLGPPSGEWKHKSSLQPTALYFAFRVTRLGAGPLENCNDKKSCYRSDERQIDYSIEIFFCEWFKRIAYLIYTCNIDACGVKGQRTHTLVSIFIPDEMQSTRFSRERHFVGDTREFIGIVEGVAEWERTRGENEGPMVSSRGSRTAAVIPGNSSTLFLDVK